LLDGTIKKCFFLRIDWVNKLINIFW